MPSTISVVIPCHNYAHLVGRAIASALGGTRAPDEVIVVDDGSTDGSGDVARAMGVRVITKPNGGMSSALNVGIANATGDIVALCDADDVCGPERLAWIESAFAADEHVVLAWHKMRMINVDGGVLGEIPPGRLVDGELGAEMASVGLTSFALTSGVAIRRAAFTAVGPIPESEYGNYGEAYLIRTLPFLGKVVANQSPLSDYLVHPGAVSRTSTRPDRAGVVAFLDRRIAQAQREHALIVDQAHAHGLNADLGRLLAYDVPLVRMLQYRDMAGDGSRWNAWRVTARRLRPNRDLPTLDRAVLVAAAMGSALLPRAAVAQLAASHLITARTASLDTRAPALRTRDSAPHRPPAADRRPRGDIALCGRRAPIAFRADSAAHSGRQPGLERSADPEDENPVHAAGHAPSRPRRRGGVRGHRHAACRARRGRHRRRQW
ncbi:MAG: glycosyltransferase family A protein [Ilumatobacteraceae bacterium]